MRNYRYIWLIAILLILCQRGWGQDSTTLSLVDRGGFSRTTSGAPNAAGVGYARLTSQDGNSVPSGLAIFGLRQDGILVTETAVPASPPTTGGRIYAEVQGAVRTGLAIANPNSQAVTLSFFFTMNREPTSAPAQPAFQRTDRSRDSWMRVLSVVVQRSWVHLRSQPLCLWPRPLCEASPMHGPSF